MTENSKVYQLYCELINDIYSNAHDVDEALNTIQKLSELVDMFDPDKRKSMPEQVADHDFVYFPSEPE